MSIALSENIYMVAHTINFVLACEEATLIFLGSRSWLLDSEVEVTNAQQVASVRPIFWFLIWDFGK